MNVIVIDDQRLSRASIIQLIEWDKWGLTFAGEYANGKEAFDAIVHNAPEIVITDVRMPLMDGLQLAEITGELHPNTSFIIVSGYDDFQYVRKSIQLSVNDYILKPVDGQELNETLGRVIKRRLAQQQTDMNILDKLRENFFYSYLGSSFDPPEEMAESFIEIQFGTTNSQFCAVMIKELTVEAKLWLNNEFSNNHMIILHYMGLQLLVINTQYLSMDYLVEVMQKLNDKFSSVPICIGPYVEGIENLQHSIRIAFDTYTMQQSLPQYERSSPVTYEQMQSVSFSKLNFNRALETEWLMNINRENWKEAQRILNVILDLFQQNNNPIPHLIDGFYSYILLKGINELYNNNMIDENQFLNACEIMKDMSSFMEASQKKQLVMSFFEEELASNSPLKKTEIKNSIQDAKEYVDKHFLENISLSELAAKYYISPSYFSTMFKQLNGVNFLDYVTKLKMEYAKHLLVNNTELKIYEVAKMCGYHDTKHFRELFRRFFDRTPQEIKGEQ